MNYDFKASTYHNNTADLKPPSTTRVSENLLHFKRKKNPNATYPADQSNASEEKEKEETKQI